LIVSKEVRIQITDRNGTSHEVMAPTDLNMNLMEVIRSFELAEEGTIGICGGMAMCASCQCYVLSDHDLLHRGDEEEAMLSEVFNVRENSRLSCQIPISEALENLHIEIAQED
jgi:ferredoxin